MTPEQARSGHCTSGGTITSSAAVCQCGAWSAADYPDATSRKLARKQHLHLVGVLRRNSKES